MHIKILTALSIATFVFIITIVGLETPTGLLIKDIIASIPYCDKVIHFSMMILLSFLLYHALKQRRVNIFGQNLLFSSLLLVIGISLEEFSQAFIPSRNFQTILHSARPLHHESGYGRSTLRRLGRRHGAANIIDIGTGTGLIAIMLAQRATGATIHAVEIDDEACAQASENMAASPWADRMHCFHAPIQDFAKLTNQRYDLVVSNPPFFSGGTFSNSQDKNSVRHTVKLPHGDLLSAVRSLLAPDGRFCMILPQMEGLRFREMANNYGIYCTKMVEVVPKLGKPVERLLLQFELHVKPMEKSALVIHNSDEANDWTAEYQQLTGEYYLKL